MTRPASVARLVALAALISVAGCASPAARHAGPGGLAGSTASPAGRTASPAAHASPSPSASPVPSPSAPADAVGPPRFPDATLTHPLDSDPTASRDESGIVFASASAVIGSDVAGFEYEWDAATGKITSTMAPPGSHANPDPDDASALALSPSGTTLAVTGGTGSRFSAVTWLFDPGTGRLTGTLPAQAGSPVSVAFSPDGATLAVAMVEETGPDKVSLWNVASRTLIRTVSDPRGEINSVAYSPSGAAIAVADVPGATVFDAATGQVIAALTDPPHRRDQPGSGNFPPSFGQAAFSPSGSMLAVTDGRGDVYVWDVATRRVIKTLTAPGQGGTTSADMVAFSPSGTMLATDGGPGAYVWDLATGQVSAELRDPGRGVSAMSFSPDSKTLGASDVDGMIYLWHTQT